MTKLSAHLDSIFFFYLLLICLLVSTATSQRFTLSTISSSEKPSPRTDHLAIPLPSADGPLLIIYGGRDKQGSKSDIWTYIVSENQWTSLPSTTVTSVRPPPLFGAVGGYRFIPGHSYPYLYVALGAISQNQLNTQMWVMDFQNFTWSTVTILGDIPTPRFGSIGSLERFIKPDGSVKPALIFTHGYGPNGPLADSYKCSFHPTDPFQVSCRTLQESNSQYSYRVPHPLWAQAGTFTGLRDLVMFGGCYASNITGGLCPAKDVWLMKYQSEQSTNTALSRTSLNDTEDLSQQNSSNEQTFLPETDFVVWERLPNGPPPQIGSAMAQGLSLFDNAYSDGLGTAVMYSGLRTTTRLPTQHIRTKSPIDTERIFLLSTNEREWIAEKVVFTGKGNKREAFRPRYGASMSVIRDTTLREEDDSPNEYYLIFGGELEDGNFSNSLLKLSFDPFLESNLLAVDHIQYTSLPVIHGLLMFVSWGLLMVAGVFSARYVKNENGRARHVTVHVLLQTLALIISWSGTGIGILARKGVAGKFIHAKFGFVLMILASLQPLIAVCGMCIKTNRGSSFRANRIFVRSFINKIHCLLGLLLPIGGLANISLGLLVLVVPIIVWVHWGTFCVILVTSFFWMEIIRGQTKTDWIREQEDRTL